ncbi:MAG: hypothetical protein IPP42_15395 [Saprospiraceae bacterium]|nr:hypothetical protein [Saprospiraceae bacterium]
MLRSLGQYMIQHLDHHCSWHIPIVLSTKSVTLLLSFGLDFLRIGRHTSQKNFGNTFLDEQARSIERRSEFRNLIASNQIIVGTLSSINGKSELFTLKRFDWVIVDEASQILEPSMLVGLLPRVKNGYSLGDHRRYLPVINCGEEDSEVQSANLKDARFDQSQKFAI